MQIGAATDPSAIVAALQNAASATGSDFHYLLGTAMRESSLKPEAQSSSSSAAGLFQFVDQTWLELVKDHGGKYGLGSMAGAIAKDDQGRYNAANDADRTAILALRKDPQISALMAGEFTKTAQSVMQTRLGRAVCGGELYAAHFLGPDAACKLIHLNETTPTANAVSAFPAAAGANKSVFFHGDGSAKSVAEVYGWAMKQPGGTVPLPATAPSAATRPAKMAANAVSADIESLLASVMNWQPTGFFSTSDASSSPLSGMAQPLALSPGILDILSSTKPGG